MAASIIKGSARPDLLRNETLADLFRHTASILPQKIALIFKEQSLTYKQLDIWSDAIAANLSSMGIGRGSRVVIWWSRGLELHAAILGIIKSGAAYVPIDQEMPAERVELVLSEVKASACFSSSALNTDCPLIQVISNPNTDKTVTAPVGPSADDCAYILYTSGSTGKPKGIAISHRQICHLIRTEQSILNVNENDRVYQGFSVSFDMWCEETLISYFVGATIWVADNTTSKAIDELSNILNEQKITILHAVPSLLAVMEEDVPTLRIVNAGGEACTPQVVNKWYSPQRILYNSYGPTETTVTATITQMKPGDPITIGDPLPNYNVAVIDEQFNVLPRGERGELVISGPGVSSGYVNRAELTEKKFIVKPTSLEEMPGDRIYLTGDAAIITPEGTIDFQGRLDDQVKLRGYRIELGEIESRLNEQPNVSASAAAIKKDSNGNDHLIGYVVCEDEVCMDESTLRSELAKVLPSYMVPAIIVSLKEMPRMPSGKINRKNLPTPALLQQIDEENASETVNLSGSVGERVLALLHKTFPGKDINLSDDFFTDLGGHSLIAAGFISRLRREGGVPYASLKDIYLNRPLDQLVSTWEKAPAATDEIKRGTFQPIVKSRYYFCCLAQTLSLFFIYSLFTVEVFTPYVSYYYVSEETGNKLLGILSAIISYCLIPPIFTLIVVAVRWLVIGKMKEGDYPLWGTYYFRWWFVKTMQRLVPSQFVSGTPLYPQYLKLFGVSVASDAQISNISIGAEDLVTIESDVSLSSQVVIDNAFVEDGILKLRSVFLGEHAYVGSSAVIAGDTRIERYGELDDLSYLPTGGRIGECEVWKGSPAELKAKKQLHDFMKPFIPSSARKGLYSILFFLMLFIFPLFILVPLFPIIISIHYLDNASSDYNFNYIVFVPVLSTLYILMFAAETIFFTRLLNAGIKAGKFSIYSSRYLKKWLADQMLSVSLVVMHPIYATVYVSSFFRLLGARVGKNTEISTASSVTHSLLEIGDEAFVADAVTLGEADVRAQQLILDKTVIHNNSFIGNSALIPQGYSLPSNMLIGVLSTPPTTDQLQESDAKDWFGSPAIGMPRRQPSNPFPKELTSQPSFKRRLARSVIEFIRIILPETAIICFSILFIAYAHDLIVSHSLSELILLLPFYYIGFMGIPALLITALLKWLFIGKYKAEQKPMWTGKVWRSEAITTTYEALAVPFLLDFLRGTAWLPLALRILGVKTGKRVYMNTTDVTEFDMVSIGTDAALNEDSGPQTHLFEDRVMKTGSIKIGDRTSIGARTIVLYDTTIGNDVKVAALSLIMKGEVMAPATSWTGSPVRPM